MDVFEPFDISTTDTLGAQIGPLRLWMRRVDDEFHLAWQHLEHDSSREVDWDSVSPRQEAKPDDVDWNRWVIPSDSSMARLAPLLPDRSLIARPEVALSIPPGQQALFFIGVPLWIGVQVGTKKPLTIREIPTESLSNTWFGDPTGGELCYSIWTRARRHPNPGRSAPHVVSCPILIRNQADGELSLQRICVRARRLNLYAGPAGLQPDEVTVTFRGDGAPSSMDYRVDQRKKGAVGEVVSKARNPQKRGSIKVGLEGISAWMGDVLGVGQPQLG